MQEVGGQTGEGTYFWVDMVHVTLLNSNTLNLTLPHNVSYMVIVTHLKSIIFKIVSEYTKINTNCNISLTNEMNDILFTDADRCYT